MEKLQFENEQFVLYSPDSLGYITDNMLDILNEKIEFYNDIFDIDYFRQFKMNYFDDLQEFREFVYELRGERESLPEYATATFDKGMINAYLSPNIDVTTRQYQRKQFLAPHELFHIMYKELIWKKENKKHTS